MPVPTRETSSVHTEKKCFGCWSRSKAERFRGEAGQLEGRDRITAGGARAQSQKWRGGATRDGVITHVLLVRLIVGGRITAVAVAVAIAITAATAVIAAAAAVTSGGNGRNLTNVQHSAHTREREVGLREKKVGC